MKNRELFRWTFTASGLWLMVSPILLFGSQSAVSQAVVGEAGSMMIMGLLALVIAGYSYSKHDLMPSYLGLVLGFALFLAPWLVEFTDTLAIWNAAVIGAILSLVALIEFMWDKPSLSNP